MAIFLTVIPIGLLLDIITKYLAVNVFKQSEIEVIKNILYFTYLENRGAAFGIMQNMQWLFIVVTFIILLVIIVYVIYKKPEDKLLNLSLAMIVCGGIGNLIDRIRLSYVIDFIDFRIIKFPVFNIADCFVVIGAILLFIYVMFKSEK